MPPEICPNCGAEVPSGAKACPECGSDEKTGWSEETRYDQLGLPDEDFDHDEFVKKEFGPEPVKPHGVAWFWWMIALVLIILAAIVFLSGILGS
jgi:hypothetical protein